MSHLGDARSCMLLQEAEHACSNLKQQLCIAAFSSSSVQSDVFLAIELHDGTSITLQVTAAGYAATDGAPSSRSTHESLEGLLMSISRDFAMRFNAAVTQTLLLHASQQPQIFPPQLSSDQDDSFHGDDDGSGLELE